MYYYPAPRYSQKKKAKVSTIRTAILFLVASSVLAGITLAITTLNQKETPRNKTIFEPGIVEAKTIEKHEETIEEHICRLWGNRCETATRIFKYENGYHTRKDWDCDIVSATSDIGITQVNHIWYDPGRPFDEEKLKECHYNIDAGFAIYQDRLRFDPDGFNAWSSYVTRAYLRYN